MVAGETPCALERIEGRAAEQPDPATCVRHARYAPGETIPSGAGSIGTCPGCAATRASQAVTFG